MKQQKNNIGYFDIDEIIEKTKELLNNLEQINEKKNVLKFVTVEDITKYTGLSKKTVMNIFNDPEFPSCDFGKTKIAELNAVLKYFSVPRRKTESSYWRHINDAA